MSWEHPGAWVWVYLELSFGREVMCKCAGRGCGMVKGTGNAEIGDGPQNRGVEEKEMAARTETSDRIICSSGGPRAEGREGEDRN